MEASFHLSLLSDIKVKLREKNCNSKKCFQFEQIKLQIYKTEQKWLRTDNYEKYNLSIHLSIYHPSINSSIHLMDGSSIHPSIIQSTHHLSIHLPIYLSIHHLSIHLSSLHPTSINSSVPWMDHISAHHLFIIYLHR